MLTCIRVNTVEKIIEIVKKYIIDNKLISKGDKLVVGVSGGADSVCLLTVLCKLKEEFDLQVHVVHVNHMLRGKEAFEDSDYVKAICETYKVSCTIFEKDIEKMSKDLCISCEEAGRNYRYECFKVVLDKVDGQKIAIAHNMNDVAETFIFNLVRGTGIKGLCSIVPKRDNIIRPLLCLPREKIEEYLCSLNIKYRTDRTNLTDLYSRNKIRNSVIPILNTINYKSTSHIYESANLLQIADDYLQQQIIHEYNKCITSSYKKNIINVSNLIKQHPFMMSEIVKLAICNTSEETKDIGSIHVNNVLDLVSKDVGKCINLPYGVLAVKEYENIVLVKKDLEEKELPVIDIRISDSGDYAIGKYNSRLIVKVRPYILGEDISKKTYTKVLDYGKMDDDIHLRTRRTGDFLIVDNKNSKKTLKKYFIDSKIPKNQRDNVLLLACGNEIIWIIGHRINEKYKVSENTKMVMAIEYIQRENNHE